MFLVPTVQCFYYLYIDVIRLHYYRHAIRVFMGQYHANICIDICTHKVIWIPGFVGRLGAYSVPPLPWLALPLWTCAFIRDNNHYTGLLSPVIKLILWIYDLILNNYAQKHESHLRSQSLNICPVFSSPFFSLWPPRPLQYSENILFHWKTSKKKLIQAGAQKRKFPGGRRANIDIFIKYCP